MNKCTCNPGSIQVCSYCARQDLEAQLKTRRNIVAFAAGAAIAVGSGLIESNAHKIFNFVGVMQ